MDSITFHDDGFFDQAITRESYYRRLDRGDRSVGCDVNHYAPRGAVPDGDFIPTGGRKASHFRSST